MLPCPPGRLPPVGCRGDQTSTPRWCPSAHSPSFAGACLPFLIVSPTHMPNSFKFGDMHKRKGVYIARQLLTVCLNLVHCFSSLAIRRFCARLSALSDCTVGAAPFSLRLPFLLATLSIYASVSSNLIRLKYANQRAILWGLPRSPSAMLCVHITSTIAGTFIYCKNYRELRATCASNAWLCSCKAQACDETFCLYSCRSCSDESSPNHCCLCA